MIGIYLVLLILPMHLMFVLKETERRNISESMDKFRGKNWNFDSVEKEVNQAKSSPQSKIATEDIHGDSTDGVIVVQSISRLRQERFAAPFKGKLGRINLKICPNEDLFKSSTEKKVKAAMSSKISTEHVTPLNISQDTKNVTNRIETVTNVTKVIVAEEQIVRLKENIENVTKVTTVKNKELWDQINLNYDAAILVEQRNEKYKPKKISTKVYVTAEKTSKMNMAKLLNKSHDNRTKYSDLVKKLIEDLPKTIKIDDNTSHMNFKYRLDSIDKLHITNDTSTKHIETIGGKHNMVDALIAKQNTLLTAEHGTDRMKIEKEDGGTKVDLNEQETTRPRKYNTNNNLSNIQSNSIYILARRRYTENPPKSKIADLTTTKKTSQQAVLKSILEKYVNKSKFDIAEDFWDQKVHKLSFNNSVVSEIIGTTIDILVTL